MYFYYISGKNTYLCREEIKKLRPERKNFKKWWNYNEGFRSWSLELANNMHSKKFQLRVELFCKENSLKLEVLEYTKALTKSINDFKIEEEFFSFLHRNNNKNIK